MVVNYELFKQTFLPLTFKQRTAWVKNLTATRDRLVNLNLTLYTLLYYYYIIILLLHYYTLLYYYYIIINYYVIIHYLAGEETLYHHSILFKYLKFPFNLYRLQAAIISHSTLHTPDAPNLHNRSHLILDIYLLTVNTLLFHAHPGREDKLLYISSGIRH